MSATDGPRWTMRVDGDALEFTLRARRSFLTTGGALVLAFGSPLMAVGCGALAFGLGLFAAEVGLPNATLLWLLALGGGCGVAAFAWTTWRGIALLLWTASGVERVRVAPSGVEIERDALGVSVSARFPLVEGAFVDPPETRGVRAHFNGLGVVGRTGGLSVTDLRRRKLRFGIDLTSQEARALFDELDALLRVCPLQPAAT